ncbi:hypothetical protein [Streptomyces cavernae]
MTAAILVLTLSSAALGAYQISLGEVGDSVLHRTGLAGDALDRVGESVL